jgi:hypothetical protein
MMFYGAVNQGVHQQGPIKHQEEITNTKKWKEKIRYNVQTVGRDQSKKLKWSIS